MTDETIPYYLDILTEIDNLDHNVSDWEANFIDNILERAERNGFTLSIAQKGVIDKMKEKYLL